MNRLLFLSAAALLLQAWPVAAQESAFAEDLRFAEALRARGDNDLALEFLKKLELTAPPELKKELPLEFAKTELRVAGDEPETAKRLALYKEARAHFEKFIADNPGHKRIPEANVEIARVLNQQGKTELSQALLNEDAQGKKEQAAQARKTLELAVTKLKAAEKALQTQLDGMKKPEEGKDPKEKKELAVKWDPVNDELKTVQFEIGMNLYDQSNTFLGGFGAEQASALLVAAKKALAPLAEESNHPMAYKARAWLGRIMRETDTDDKANDKFKDVFRGGPIAAEGIRLASYFQLLAVRDKPNGPFYRTEADKKAGAAKTIIARGNAWRTAYPRFHKTPEGFGVSFLLAETLLQEAEAFDGKKGATQADKATANAYRERARALLDEVESSENEFTDRARRLKIQTIARQGLFKVPIAKLAKFEDCFIRAQYEAIQMRDAKEEKQRKEHIDNILAALVKALKLVETMKPAEKKQLQGSLKLNTARAMLVYWSLNSGKFADVIEIGEKFARDDPRSSQAEMCAIYALEAYSRSLEQLDAKSEAFAKMRARMLRLARYMEERWPKGAPGDTARYVTALRLLKEDNFAEGIKKLSLISPSYGSYTLSRYLLADFALKAEAARKDGAELIPGDRPGDYRKRALAALASMPESALGADPVTNQLHLAGKAILGREWYKDKRFTQMETLASGLLPRADKLRFNDDPEKDKSIRTQLKFELMGVSFWARYGLAGAAFDAGDHAKVVAIIDPVIDQLVKPEETLEKTTLEKTPSLAMGLLYRALQSNMQLGKIDRTDVVLDAMDKVTAGENAERNSNDLLKFLAGMIRKQVDEVRAKGDKELLDKTIKGFTAILDKRIKKQKGQLTPDFIRILADCYSNMGEHEKSAAELGKVPEPKGKEDSPEMKEYRKIQLAIVRELRLSKKPDAVKKAREMLDVIQGTKAKPGWGMKKGPDGRSSPFAAATMKEQGMMLEAEEKWKESFAHWSLLVRILVKQAGKDNNSKEFYLESYYHMVYSFLKSPSKDHDKSIRQAGAQIAQLEHSWEDFGSDSSKKRFTELLASDPALKAQYEAAKNKKKR
jgi:tetratricopeptide (TPR) repeat protein